MSTMRAMYGLRRVNLAVVNRLMSASTIHLLNLPSEPAASNLVQGLQDLQAMSLNHQFAARCIDIIHSLAAKWNIVLPEGGIPVPRRNKGGIHRQLSSPTASNFWAASIPRKESSDNSSKSNGSGSQKGSPFMPPSSNPPQRHDSYQPFHANGMTSGVDLNDNSNAFWTPFPLQNAPVPPQNVVPSMPMDMSPIDGSSGQQWQSFNSPVSSAPSQLRNPPASQSLQGMMDGMAFQGWQWQTG